MDKGKGKSKATLGDSASDFMAQWKASKPDRPPPPNESASSETGKHCNLNDEQTFRSWRRGGGEVRVTKGTSKGYEKRQRKQFVPPLVNLTKELASWRQIVNSPPPRILQPDAVPIAKTARQRLLEASADVRDLRISAAMSHPHGFDELSQVIEDKDGKLAILGLDFGTAFTKAVVRWSRRHYAVDWSDAVEGDDHHLLASVFSEASDGRCMLGAHVTSGWSVREGIKLKLLSSDGKITDERMTDAVIFIALAFRYVDAWLRRIAVDVNEGARWRLHVGLPTKAWDNDATTEAFKSVAQAARLLAFMPGSVTRIGALEVLQMTHQVNRPAVDVFPEFACQLYSYLMSAERGEDLHVLVDIGAGTLDVAYFNVFMKDGEALLPIFACDVDMLGAHYLIAALSGAVGRPDWMDSESSLSDEEVGLKVGCPSNEVGSRRSLYLSSLADVFNKATATARKAYPTSPAFRRAENVRLFLCGGGSRIPSIQKHFDRIARDAEKVMGIKFHVTGLVKLRDVVGMRDFGFDRISVAYGLSQIGAEIGRVMRSASLEPIAERNVVERGDRDADR